jgi:ubiquinone/menaquinone biosynthesis C-methylase UbiE
MPIQPNLLERTAFYSLNLGPAPLLDIWGALGFQTVATAIRLGIFEALKDGPRTPISLAKSLELNPHGVKLLLETLETLGYTKLQGEAFANSPMTAKWLTSDSEANFAPYFTFWETVIPALWGRLDESLRTGHATINLYEWIESQPETSAAFQRAMIAIAHLIKGEAAEKLKFLAGAKRLLDVGGGHGEFVVAICQKYPQLRAVLFDSPQALATGRDHVTGTGLGERVTFQEGSFLTEELGRGYDVVLLYNILHGFDGAQNTDLFRKTKRALNPGGRVVILEQLDEKLPSQAYNTIGKLLSLSYFHLLNGRVYAYQEIVHWLEEGGFAHIQRINLMKVPGTALIVGRV